MQSLIEELADLILKDNAILFVGSELSLDESKRPMVEQIADALAARIDYQRQDRSLSAVARDYEVLQGRNALILALRDELSRLEQGPDPIHQLIADAVLPTTKLITTRFDQVLERALTQFEKPYVLIVRDTDVPFFDESRVTVIKIQGDIGQPDSLVITEDDVDAFINNLPTLSDIVRAFFATKTLIFLGYDLNSAHFKRFFNQVTRNLSVYRRTAYAIVPQAEENMDEVGRRYWQNQNVEIVYHDPLPFMENLAQQVKEAKDAAPERADRLPEAPPLPLPPAPYKGLQPYSEDDAPIFAGRNQESMQLANRVLANRLTILYGESGVGKSSLLRAGLGRRIATQRGLMAVAHSEPGRPLIAALQESLLVSARQAGIVAEGGGDLADSVRAVQRSLDGPVVLAIDQAEQFFLVYDEEERLEALGQLQRFLNDRSLNLRFVIAIREDALGRLQPLETILPDVLNVRYRLERLGREAAREAIESPAALYDARWESDLVQRLLHDLTDPESGGIGPPQLQINCERLYRETVSRAAAPPYTISLALFESLGNTTSLLGDFLTETIQSLEPTQQPPARNLLGALVSSSGVKLRLTLAELALFVDNSSAEALDILNGLVERSLVRRVSRPRLLVDESAGPAKAAAASAAPEATAAPEAVAEELADEASRDEFELSHDSLIPRVVSWLGDEFWATQKAREILRQAAPEWTKRARLLPADDLRLATLHRSQLRVTPVEAALLYASAVTYVSAVADWEMALSPQERRGILLKLLEHPNREARSQTAAQLAAFADEECSRLLGQRALLDAEAEVRSAAIAGLAAHVQWAGPDAAAPGVAAVIDGLEKPATDGYARDALVSLRDLAPESDGLLPSARRSIIRRKVWLARWERHAEVILRTSLRGAQGGFWGLGLGMGLFLGLNILIADGFTIPLLMQRLDSILFGVSAGIPIMGLIGGLAGGVTGLAGAVARYVPDSATPRSTWLVQSVAGGIAMMLGWLIFAIVMPGDVRLWQTLTAGLVVGSLLAAGSTQPFVRHRVAGAGLSMAVGVLAFLLLGMSGLIFNAVTWWLVVMGGVAGAGFFWGMNPEDDD